MRYDNNRRDNRTAFTWRLFIMRYTVRTITKKKKKNDCKNFIENIRSYDSPFTTVSSEANIAG